MSANVQFGEGSGRPGDGRPGTSAPTNGGEAMDDGMVGRDVLGAPPPPNGHVRRRDDRDWAAMDPAGNGRPGTSAPTNDGATGGTMCDGPGATDIDGATGSIMRDGTGDGMVGRDVLGAPPPPNGHASSRNVRRAAAERAAGDVRPYHF